MRKILVVTLALVATLFLKVQAAGQQVPDIGVMASVRVQVPSDDTKDLRAVVAGFAGKHGFQPGQESTMPPNRKVFLVLGTFSTTYRSTDDTYLLVHNVAGKDCVVLELYGSAHQPEDDQLMADLKQAIEAALPHKVKFVDSDTCGDQSSGQ